MRTVLWLGGFAFLNLMALVIFMVPHELVQASHVDGFMPYLLVLAIGGYLVLRSQLLRFRRPWSAFLMNWTLGFHLLFWAEMIMEAVVFTVLDFHNTDANDPYFIAFWVLILMWTVVGGPWLYRRQRQASAQRA